MATVSAAIAAYNANKTGVAAQIIADTAANIAANLDVLNAMALGGKIASISFSSTARLLSITATQLNNDAAILNLLPATYTLSISAVLAANSAAIAANTHVTAFVISDTAINITTKIADLIAAGTKLTSITETGLITPVALAYSQYSTTLTAKFSNFTATVNGVPAGTAATVLTNAKVASIAVADTAANLAANINALQTAGTKLTAITQSDTGPLTITSAQLTADATALGKINNGVYSLNVTAVTASTTTTVAANTHVISLAVSDTAANIRTNLTALINVGSKLTTIAETGTVSVIALTAAQYTSAFTAKFTNFTATVSGLSAANAAVAATDAKVTGMTVLDTSANIAKNLDALQIGVAKITSITQSGTLAPLSIIESQLANDLGILEKIGTYTLNVSNIAAANTAAVLSNMKVVAISVADSAANLSANFDALSNIGTKLIAIVQKDSSPISLTYAQYTLDSYALGKMTGNYSFSITGVALQDAVTLITNPHVTNITLNAYSSLTENQFNTLSGKLTNTDLTITNVLATDAQAIAADRHVAHITLDANILTEAQYTSTVAGKVTNTGLTITNVFAADAANIFSTFPAVSSLTVQDSFENIFSNVLTLDPLVQSGLVHIEFNGSHTTVSYNDLHIEQLATSGGTQNQLNAFINRINYLTDQEITVTNVPIYITGPSSESSFAWSLSSLDKVGKVLLAASLQFPDGSPNSRYLPWDDFSIYNSANLHKIFASDGVTPALNQIVNVPTLQDAINVSHDASVYGVQLASSLTNIGVTYAQYSDGDWGKIEQNLPNAFIVITDAPLTALTALATDSHIASISIKDTIDNIGSHLSSLVTLNKIGELGNIIVTDASNTALAYSQLDLPSGWSSVEVNSVFTHVTNISLGSLVISGVPVNHPTGGSVSSDAMGLAKLSVVGKVILTNSPSDASFPWPTYASYDATAMHKIFANDGITAAGTKVRNVDTIEHLTALLDLDYSVYGASLVSTDSNTSYTTYSKMNQYHVVNLNGSVTAHLIVLETPANDVPYTPNYASITQYQVQDTAQNIANNADALKANLQSIASISVTDPSSVVHISRATYNADYGVFSLISGFNYVIDGAPAGPSYDNITIAQLEAITDFSNIPYVTVKDTSEHIHTADGLLALQNLGTKLTHITFTTFTGWVSGTFTPWLAQIFSLPNNSVTVQNVDVTKQFTDVTHTKTTMITSAFNLANNPYVDKVMLSDRIINSTGLATGTYIYTDNTNTPLNEATSINKALPMLNYFYDINNPTPYWYNMGSTSILHKIYASDGVTPAVTAIKGVDTLDHLFTILANDASVWGATIGDTGYTTTAYKSLYHISYVGTAANLVVMDPIFGTLGDDLLVGGAANNYINGEGGNDTINGMGGTNILVGGSGNTQYVVDYTEFNGADTKIYNTITDSGGVDRLQISLNDVDGVGDHNFYANIRRSGIDGKDFTVGIGHSENSVAGLDPWLGKTVVSDQYHWDSVGRQFTTSIEAMHLTYPNIPAASGSGGDLNLLLGVGSTQTVLNGSDSADLLMGWGSGNVINGGIGDDFVIGSRFDTQEELNTYNVRNTLSGVALVTLSNVNNLAKSDSIIGDTLNGGSGNDYLEGYYGNDVLNGGDGNDILIGREGSNTLNGGAGDDTYVVTYSASTGSDTGIHNTITDTVGVDTLDVSFINVDYNIAFDFARRTGVNGADLEIGVVDARDASGVWDSPHVFANTIISNQYDSSDPSYKTSIESIIFSSSQWDSGTPHTFNLALDSRSTAKNLIGSTSDDVIFGFGGGSLIEGGDGNDILRASLFRGPVEELADAQTSKDKTLAEYLGLHRTDLNYLAQLQDITLPSGPSGYGSLNSVTYLAKYGVLVGDVLSGGSGDDDMQGGYGNDTLNGGDGNDILDDSGGNNLLTGGAGNDTFVFWGYGELNLNTITGFVSAQDGDVDNVDRLDLHLSSFTGLHLGNLDDYQFYADGGAISALDANQRIIYDTKTGALYYDQDGAGGVASVQIAALVGVDNKPAHLLNSDIHVV